MTYSVRFLLTTCALLCPLLGSAVLAEEWHVGFRLLHVADPVIHQDFEVALWYPTRAEPQDELLGPAVLRLARNAQPLDSAQGLILISHGFSGSFLGHNDTARWLAQHGYLVATPTHPDRQGLTAGRPEFDPLVMRPRHLRLTLDKLLNQPPFKISLPSTRIGIIGFSLGAYAALITLGAVPDLSGLTAYCAAQAQDALLCSAGATRRLEDIAPLLTAHRDGRIKAAVLLAPAYAPLFAKQSFAHLTSPILMFSAENDEELDNRYQAQRFEQWLASRAKLEVVKGAGHYIFMAPCPEQLRQALPAVCEDAKDIDRMAIHRKLNGEILSFFNETLK